MPIQILDSADPLSDAALKSDNEGIVRNAQSDAGRVLKLELVRYCRAEVHGRSFLIAGHRGSGKTMMVADALDKVLRASRRPGEQMLRPLPIFLHGPSLFEVEAEAADTAKPDDARRRPRRAPAAPVEADHEAQARVALKQIILGLHRAVVREFVRAFRHRLVEGPVYQQPIASQADIAELAGQFEIEITEDPTAARLHEFWSMAGALQPGVLFDAPSQPDQGVRELVALNGMCNAHQRISGEISAQDKSARSESAESEAQSGAELRGAELVKPLVSVLAGAAVAGGVAAGAHSLGMAMAGGLAAAIGSGAFFRSSTTTKRRAAREVDTTFIPDLSLKTLDRILPTLIQRLRDCGLAPVLVIDELDKVVDLPTRLVGMIHFLKKLLAENVFTCFLTDRGYLEHLRLRGNGAAYGPAYSYFSHPLLIAYLPCDFEGYLEKLLKADRASVAPVDPAASSMASVADIDNLDLEVLKWVLRHRSQLHALALAREIAAVRGENATVEIAAGAVRTEFTYRIDVTFQVAIELQLAQPHVQAWLRQRPDMSQTLFDALYYLSRHWLKGTRRVQREGAVDDFQAYLVRRMNLEELRDVEITTSLIEGILSLDDRLFLDGVLLDLQRMLGPGASEADLALRWNQLPPRSTRARTDPGPSVLQCLLSGPQSLLTLRTPDSPVATDWRYWPSGVERVSDEVDDVARGAPRPPSPDGQGDAAAIVSTGQGTAAAALKIDLDAVYRNIQRIDAVDANLRDGFLKGAGDGIAANGQIFELLGDRVRLLPTTPAWPRVRTAIDNIEQLRLRPDAGGSSMTLMEDQRAIEGFVGMLDTCAPVIARALLLATFLGAARNVSDGVAVMPSGLAVLAAGLGFAARDVPGIDIELTRLKTALAAQVGMALETLWETASGCALHEQPIVSLSRVAQDLGAAFARGTAGQPRIDAAWHGLGVRLDAALESRLDLAAGIDELLCNVTFTGPARFVGLDLKAMTLRRWTTAFVRAASVDRSPPDGEEVPAWLIGHALNRLGGPSLQSQELESLIEWAIGDRDVPTTFRDDVHSLASRLQPNEPEPDQTQRIAVCVTSGDDSPMAWWTRAPRRGVAFVIEASDLFLMLNGPARAVRNAFVLAVAQGRGIRLPEREMREAAATQSAARLVWVYRTRLTEMLEPSLVDPQTADELFDQMVVLPQKK